MLAWAAIFVNDVVTVDHERAAFNVTSGNLGQHTLAVDSDAGRTNFFKCGPDDLILKLLQHCFVYNFIHKTDENH